MKKEKLMNAIGGISDSHITEFADTKPKKKSVALWAKIASVAACIALILIAIPVIKNSVNAPKGPVSAIPYVKINNMVYIIDSDYANSAAAELPDRYVIIGKVQRNPASGKFTETLNGDAAGCKAGEEIFQSPDSPNEIYVYTALFSGSGEYRYIRFVYNETPVDF